MKLKLALASATAMTLMTAVALADSNWTSVKQSGNGNSADVTQDSSGSGNWVRLLQGQATPNEGDNNTAVIDQLGIGNKVGHKSYGDGQWTLRQYGDNNLVDIEQTGRNNEIGLDNGNRYGGRSSNVGYGGTVGVQQTGSHNILTVEQSNAADGYSENQIGAVRQTGDAGATATTNELIIIQEESAVTSVSGPRHFVGLVRQTNAGPGASAADKNLIDIHQTGGGHPNPNGLDGHHIYKVTQTGTANSADLDQHGHANRIRTVTQTGTENDATVSQDGFGNVVVSVTQDNSGGGALGNQVTLTFAGDDNGTGGFTSGAAGDLSLPLATVSQLGDDNLVNYNVTGNANLFAFSQTGDGNEVQGTVNGDGNQVAVLQTGAGNFTSFQQIGGGNNIGVSQ